jgi:hypothetical protein
MNQNLYGLQPLELRFMELLQQLIDDLIFWGPTG